MSYYSLSKSDYGGYGGYGGLGRRERQKPGEGSPDAAAAPPVDPAAAAAPPHATGEVTFQ